MTRFALDPLDLAALLCSRVCHDVISPVGAIINGLEVLDEDNDAETRVFALELVKKSAEMASAKLQFCRLAFGAAGSIGASIDTGDAESVTRGLYGEEKVKLEWNVPRVLLAKNKVKLILNLCLVAAGCIPRGGTIVVDGTGEGNAFATTVKARGPYARIASGIPGLLLGEPDGNSVDAQAIQPYYAGLVARAAGMDVSMRAESDAVVIEARPALGSTVEPAADRVAPA